MTSVLRQVKAANRIRCSQFGKHTNIEDWSLTDWGCATAGEVGELCNVLKKIHRGDFTVEEANEQELIADEVADVVIYLDMLCQKAGIDLETAIVNKFNKKSEQIGSELKIYYY